MANVKRIAVTGGAGQIAYSLLFRIASGELLGPNQKIALNILEIPEAVGALKGVEMELRDCAYPLVEEIKIGSDPNELFEDIDIAILVGAKPRSKGQERKDLLLENGKIFVPQGKALSDKAKKEVLVFVVGNPCNTNCLIAMHNAPNIDPTQFFAMTTLDHNRARYQLANKAGVPLLDVDGVTIWGNHSATQVPDFTQVKIKEKSAEEVIGDRNWLETEFFQTVAKRGAAVLEARGKSSAASAANAILDGVKNILFGASDQSWFSTALLSNGNPYGIEEDLIFSFPCTQANSGKIEIVPNLKWDSFIEEKIRLTREELIGEKREIAHLLSS